MKKFLSLVLALGLSISVLSAAVFAEDAPAEAQAEGSVPASTLEPAEMTSWPLHHVDVRIPGMVEVRRVDENGNVQSTEQVQVGVHAVSMKKNGLEMGPFYPKAGLPEQQKEFEWRNDELCLSVDDDLSITCKVFGTLADGTVCLPARMDVLEEGEKPLLRVVIMEGKYHQIKRMLGVLERPVLSLKRVSIGGLLLDDSLSEGQCRELSPVVLHQGALCDSDRA